MAGTSVRLETRVPQALSVSELAGLLRDTLRSNPLLDRVTVRGETSNVQQGPSGTVFLTLKDDHAEIACVLFHEAASGLAFDLENGMDVLATGEVGLYARKGEVQLVLRSIEPVGVGKFWATFQRTRRRLAAEGLFEESRKRPLPAFPRRIGVVTSERGAVFHDIVTVLRRRFPLAAVLLSPAVVQGPDAPGSVRRALDILGPRVDLVIIARGGGSLEDLWGFNDESLARSVVACPVPVVSAIGHETDVTILDFVADLRAPTPSVAAELASPDLSDLAARVRTLGANLVRYVRDALREGWSTLARSAERISPAGLRRGIGEERERLRRMGISLARAGSRLTERHGERLTGLGRRLDALSPLATLRRGYAIVSRPDGRIVSRAAEVSPEDSLAVRLQDGRVHVHALGKEVS